MGGGDFINVTQDFMMSWNKGQGILFVHYYKTTANEANKLL